MTKHVSVCADFGGGSARKQVWLVGCVLFGGLVMELPVLRLTHTETKTWRAFSQSDHKDTQNCPALKRLNSSSRIGLPGHLIVPSPYKETGLLSQ